MIEALEPGQVEQGFVRGVAAEALHPDPRETVSEWADKFMILPTEDAEPGPWRTSRVPFMKKIMDALSPWNDTREVILMKPVQISGTSAGLCWAGHTIHRAPTNMLIVEPTLDLAKKYSRQRLTPMIDNVPEVGNLVEAERARDSGNTIFEKEFRGGRACLTGSNSAVGLRFMAARNLMLDEVDAYVKNLDQEGDPIRLAKNRTATYYRHKIYMLSTPKLKATSAIEPAYLQSDQQKYFVPCPFCDHGQVLEWGQLTWPKGKPEEAAYLCVQCQQLIAEHHKMRMLAQGDWVATRDTSDDGAWRPKRAGFWLNILYQPYGWKYNWPTLAFDFSEIAHSRDADALQEFTNTKLAETWEEELGEKIDHSDLWNRREIYPAPVPDEVLHITAAVDVQDDRLEAEAKGWGLGEESWAIEKQVFVGSPGILKGKRGDPSVWELLDAWLMKSFTQSDHKKLSIAVALIDSGGHHTKEVYQFVKPRQSRRIFALKGSNQPATNLLAGCSTKNAARVRLYSIGTNAAKDTIFSRLKLTEPGPGYIHWPQRACYDEEHFLQLTAEVKVEKRHKGIVVGSYYKKIRARNEALDLEAYNMLALAVLNPQLHDLPRPVHKQQPTDRPDRPAQKKDSWIKKRSGWLRR